MNLVPLGMLVGTVYWAFLGYLVVTKLGEMDF